MHRRPSHLSDASASVYRMPSYRGTTLLGSLVPTGEHVDASGGWFDAGDYLKFVETASFTDVALLYTAREYPTGVSDRAALLAEARYGTDWLLKMWDQSRRVLYFQVGIGDGNDTSILGDHDLWRLPQADNASRAKPGSRSDRGPPARVRGERSGDSDQPQPRRPRRRRVRSVRPGVRTQRPRLRGALPARRSDDLRPGQHPPRRDAADERAPRLLQRARMARRHGARRGRAVPGHVVHPQRRPTPPRALRLP